MAKKTNDLYVFDFDKRCVHTFKTTKQSISETEVKSLGYGFSDNIKFMLSPKVETIKHSGVFD